MLGLFKKSKVIIPGELLSIIEKMHVAVRNMNYEALRPLYSSNSTITDITENNSESRTLDEAIKFLQSSVEGVESRTTNFKFIGFTEGPPATVKIKYSENLNFENGETINIKYIETIEFNSSNKIELVTCVYK
jgi:hypothetical protein